MTETANNSQDFIGLLTEVIEANLQNSQFGVNELANKMGLERSTLHRKVIKASNISETKTCQNTIEEINFDCCS